MWITTGSENDDNATLNSVILYVYGDKDVSGPNTLESGKEEKYFQKGATDDFKVNLNGLGDLYKIRIGQGEEDTRSGWFLEKVSRMCINYDVYKIEFIVVTSLFCPFTQIVFC